MISYFLFSCIVFMIGTTPDHLLNSQNMSEQLSTIEQQLNDVSKKLDKHEENSTLEFFGGINVALYSILISLILSIFASVQSLIDQKKLKKFIERTKLEQEANIFFQDGKYEESKAS